MFCPLFFIEKEFPGERFVFPEIFSPLSGPRDGPRFGSPIFQKDKPFRRRANQLKISEIKKTGERGGVEFSKGFLNFPGGGVALHGKPLREIGLIDIPCANVFLAASDDFFKVDLGEI